VSDPSQHAEETSTDAVEQLLDDLLGDAVVYEAGQAPPEREAAPTADSFDEVLSPSSPALVETRVSPVFWAAAVVWSLPGGLGGWWLLRKTHPRTARRLLVVGIVAFLITGAIVIAMIVAQHRLNPSYVFIRK
jgi:hypothetical protein